MAQVTVDYEEFAALKKREADYEKMVEDLKKENQELKDTRKEIASINEIIDNIEDKIHYGVNKVKHKSEEEIKEEEFVNCPWMEDVPYNR